MQNVFERIEKKYVITKEQYKTLLSSMHQYFKPDTYADYTLHNLYFDTRDYILLQASTQTLPKPVFKQKFRIRCYTMPNTGVSIYLPRTNLSGLAAPG